jgi:SAM-dependent methyltransferase
MGAATLAACRACGTLTADPRPTPEQTAEVHDSEDYFHKAYFEGRRDRPEATERRFRSLLGLIGDVRPDVKPDGARLLDIGCDTGAFAAAGARLGGFVPYGVDVARRPLDAARAAGVNAFHGDLAAAPETFDDFGLITAIDVIEHVADPVRVLADARRRLARAGLVYVETPNRCASTYVVGGILARLSRLNSSAAMARLFPPEHVQYFTAAGLERAAGRAGLRPLRIFGRRLGREALVGGAALQLGMAALQFPDALRSERLLICGLFEESE